MLLIEGRVMRWEDIAIAVIECIYPCLGEVDETGVRWIARSSAEDEVRKALP